MVSMHNCDSYSITNNIKTYSIHGATKERNPTNIDDSQTSYILVCVSWVPFSNRAEYSWCLLNFRISVILLYNIF